MAFEHTEIADYEASMAFELAAVAGQQAAISLYNYAVTAPWSVVITEGNKAAADLEKAT